MPAAVAIRLPLLHGAFKSSIQTVLNNLGFMDAVIVTNDPVVVVPIHDHLNRFTVASRAKLRLHEYPRVVVLGK